MWQCVPILCLHFRETTGPFLLKANINTEKGEKKKKRKQANKQNDKRRTEVRCASKVQISKIWEHHYLSCAVPVVCRAVISHASISVGDSALVAGNNIYYQKEQITLSWLSCLIYIASSSLESLCKSLPPATDLRPHFFPKGNGSGF